MELLRISSESERLEWLQLGILSGWAESLDELCEVWMSSLPGGQQGDWIIGASGCWVIRNSSWFVTSGCI
jgi:hypothetical protein